MEYVFEMPMAGIPTSPNENGQWTVVAGSGIFEDPFSANTYVTGMSLGENIFSWIVSNRVCPPSVDYVTIAVNDLVIPTLITPNMDGQNDYFVLRGIETLGKTELVVFDRRGKQVYKNINYANEWYGYDFNNEPLPDDTYFFTIKTENGKSISGYLVIRR
jgi:gliding motility-associated-like protein